MFAVVLALGAVAAMSASAAATTTVEPWRTGTTAGGTTVLTGSQAVTARAAGNVVFESQFSTGTPLKIEAFGLECISCTISNVAGGAQGEGKIELRNVTVVTPLCTITSGPLVSAPLKFDWTYMIGTTAYAQVVPASGTTLFSFSMSGSAPCPGSYKIIGGFFLKQVNATATYTVAPEVTFSKPINETAGGSLALGTKEAGLFGTAKFEAAGKFFGVE